MEVRICLSCLTRRKRIGEKVLCYFSYLKSLIASPVVIGYIGLRNHCYSFVQLYYWWVMRMEVILYHLARSCKFLIWGTCYLVWSPQLLDFTGQVQDELRVRMVAGGYALWTDGNGLSPRETELIPSGDNVPRISL